MLLNQTRCSKTKKEPSVQQKRRRRVWFVLCTHDLGDCFHNLVMTATAAG